MSESIINTLGFNVDEALSALARLDTALKTSSTAFATFGTALTAFNSQASAALRTMQELSAAASKLSSMAAPAAPAATAAPASQLWLPPGVKEDIAGVNSALTQTGQIAGGIPGKIKPIAGATEEADKHAKGLGISWETIGRIMITQAIVRAMSAIRDALQEAVSSSLDFQKAIAEIQTIAPRVQAGISAIGMATPFESLTREVAAFSKSLNIPLPKVAEGLYQTLSDQFTSVTDRTNVMTAAAELSKIAVVDFDKAVSLITGTLNAYGMQSSQASQLTAEFFETIRLGRIRGAEMVAVYGQVMPVAAELSVSISEVNAAMAALTIGGLDYAKSATALRGTMMALLKPSDEMKKIFKELGFSTGEQLIAAKGYQGALQAVADAADGMGSKIAAAVPNVRALVAEFRLTSEQGAKKYAEALEAMKKITPEAIQQILKEFRAIDAEQLGKSWNALKVNMTQDIGSALVGLLKWMTEAAGGADKLTAAIVGIAAAAVTVGAALVVLAAGFALVHVAMGPVGWTIFGITAALALLAGTSAFTSEKNVLAARAESDARTKAANDYIGALAKVRAAESAAAAAANRETYGQWEAAAASLRRNYLKALDELKEKNQVIVESSRQTLEAIIAVQERVVSAYRNAAQAAARGAEEAGKAADDLRDKLEDLQFKEARIPGLTWGEALERELGRAADLAKQARDALNEAETPKDAQAALPLLQRALAAAELGKQTARHIGDVGLLEQAQQAVYAVMRQQIQAQERLREMQTQAAEELAAKAAKEQERLAILKVLMKDILEGLNAFDKKGEAKEPADLAAQRAMLQERLAQLKAVMLGAPNLDMGALMGLDSLQQRIQLAIEGGVSKAQINALYATPTAIAELHDVIEQGIKPVRVLIEYVEANDPALAGKMQGKPAADKLDMIGSELGKQLGQQQQFDDLARSSVDLGKVVTNEIRDTADRFKKVAADIRGQLTDLGNIESLGRGLLIALGGGGIVDDVINKQLSSVKAFTAAISKFTTPGVEPDAKDFAELVKARDNLLKAVQPPAALAQQLRDLTDQASRVQAAVDAAKTASKGLEAIQPERNLLDKQIPAIQQGLQDGVNEAIKLQLEGLKAKQQIDGAKAATEDVSQINMGGLTSGINSSTAAMWGLAQSAQMALQAVDAAQNAASGDLYAAHGGVARYFASGGNVGMDTINAKLSPGEVVINPRSARNFASQLTAMNAGVQPVYRSDGGSVTNIGDINVSVTGGGSSRQTARSIASELRRELRRGTSTL